MNADGTVTLKRESYRRAQERQRIAEVRREAAEEERDRTYVWARECCAQERRAWDRATYLYGLAARLGASDEELAGEPLPPKGSARPEKRESESPHMPEERQCP